MTELARKAIETALAALLEREPGARAGKDPEELHKMRVASRRLRAALSTFAPLFPPKQLEKRRRELRRLGRALGAVRECDVFAETLASLEIDDARARAAVAGRRAAERTRLLATLDEAPLTPLAERVRALAAAAHERRGAAKLAERVLEKRMTPAFAGLAVSAEADRAPALHARRIAVKKLRYSIDALGDALPARLFEALLSILKPLQEALGRHHDVVALAQFLWASCVRSPIVRLRAERRRAFADYARLARCAARLTPSPVPERAGAPAARRTRAPAAPPTRRRRRPPS